MSYLCRAERQVLAKAYASSLDLNLSAPSRGTQVCRTSKPRLCVSSIVGCQQKQHGFFACVYRFSTTTKQPSTDSVNEEKKCLVESGKVKPHDTRWNFPPVPMALSRERNGIFEGKEWHFRGVTRYRNTSFLPSEHLERIIRTTHRRHPFHALPFPSSMTDSTERFTRDFLFSISPISHGNSLIIRPCDIVILKIKKN